MSNAEFTRQIEIAAQRLIEADLTIAFAESATAGRASAEFSLACDAGKFLKGGLVCYDATLKSKLLGVPQDLLDSCTPESMEVTEAIASGLQKLIAADIHIGITGLPCSGGSESPEKPVGTMFICGLKNGEPLFRERVVFNGNHQEIVMQTVGKVAQLITSF